MSFRDSVGEPHKYIMITREADLLIGISEMDKDEMEEVAERDNNICLNDQGNISVGLGMDTIDTVNEDALVLTKEEFINFLSLLYRTCKENED